MALGRKEVPFVRRKQGCAHNVTGQVILFFGLLFFAFSRATPVAYGDSQARGLIRAVAALIRNISIISKSLLVPQQHQI